MNSAARLVETCLPRRRLGVVAGGLIAALLLAVLAVMPQARGEEPAATSPKVQELLQLLADKDVQNWLAGREAAIAGKPAEPSSAAQPEMVLSAWVASIRQHLVELAAAIPRLPHEFATAADRLRQVADGFGPIAIMALAASFILGGLIVEWAFRWLAGGAVRPRPGEPAPTTPGGRAIVLLGHLMFGVGGVIAFVAGSFGAFVLFQWPPLLRAIVITFLFAAVGVMIARVVLALLFGSPHADTADRPVMRLLPMNDETARHFHRRLGAAIAWFAFGHAFVQMERLLAVDEGVVMMTAYALGVVLLAIGIEAVWRCPAVRPAEPGDGAVAAEGRASAWFYTICFMTLWCLWVAGTAGLFWLLALAIGLPLAIRWSRRAVRAIFEAATPEGDEAPVMNVTEVIIERGLRAVLILGAVLVLAWTFEVRAASFTGGEEPLMKIARNVLKALVMLLVADFVWQLVKTMIDAVLFRTADPAAHGSEAAIRQARLRTLLPIVRNILMVFLATLAVLMVLSSLGVEIGPLIASAGVVGVAIGFGAQTLVKDVISGMFYLLDDAFRVGEYIISGKFKGTVESFSLRSVRLRHHNGPVFTIPFGELGAVENMSRDFVIDKFTLTVTYDSDLEKVRKLIKKIGEKLMQDPELEGMILEPMKMQRVDQFGDYGMVVKVKIKTRPGEQFMVRKKAFPMIKQSFAENGIKFASPTVKVAEADDDTATAAARAMLAHQADKAEPA